MDLITAVQKAGVVGAGGAGFPTHVKLAAQVELVVVNGAECEPLLHVDQELMKAHAPALVEGLAACMAATGAAEGVFALKEKYKPARRALEEAIGPRTDMRVVMLGNYYPAGDEHVLVYEVTGRVVPEGGIPLHVGAVVINVETLLNVQQALQGQPVTHTYVTVSGAVAEPCTLCVAVGTPAEELIAAAGGATERDTVVINGGPVMGNLLSDLGDPVAKTTKGLIVLPAAHPHARRLRMSSQIALERAASACCQCRDCTDLCPRYLLGHAIEPHRAMRAMSYALAQDTAAWTAAFLCSDCGVCDTFACPAGISPRHVYRAMKANLAAAGAKNPHRAQPTPRPERPNRRVPADRLLWRMGLAAYEGEAPLRSEPLEPEMVKIPLKQNAGAPGVAVVQPGDYVARGQVVAQPPEGALGAVHHASIAGSVVSVSDQVVIRRG